MRKISYILVFLLFLTTSTVLALQGSKKIDVTFKNITIFVNGERVSSDAEPFIYNGRTFVPIRVVSEALNKDVKWDSIYCRIDINDKPLGNKGPGSGETTVYITDTGDKYHLDGCRYLNESKIAILLSEAKAKGYKPCGVCKPPE